MTEITTQSQGGFEDFKKKLEEKIRDDIGSLIPDEALQGIIEKGIEKAFFEERRFPGDYRNNYRDHIEPAWITTALRESLDSVVQEQVKEWMKENSERMESLIREQLDGGLVKAVARAISVQFSGSLVRLESDILSKIQDSHQ